MIERDVAVRMVEEDLERECRRERELGLEPVRAVVTSVRRHELAWIVAWTSEEYLRTGNPSTALVGNGPYLVDLDDGSLHRIGVLAARSGEWEADYRTRIRGETTRTALDDLHDDVRAVAETRGRVRAMRLLRRSVPELTHEEVAAYVTGLRAGEVPDRLVALAAEVLVPEVGRRVITVRGAGRDGSRPTR
ncbi:YrhB domain-containing protein [Streptomyces sp. NPDC055051]